MPTVAPSLWSIGGFGDSRTLRYDVTTDHWDDEGSHPDWPGPDSPHNFAIGAIGGKIYIAGGYSGLGIVQDACYEFDPATNVWTTKTPMPTPTQAAGSAVLGDKLYVVGGNQAPAELATVQVYDPATDTWSLVAALPVTWSENAAGAAGGKIYAIAGVANGVVLAAFNDAYDPGSNTWTAKSTAGMTPTVLSAAAGVVGKVYVVGGDTHLTGGAVLTDAVQVYDPIGNSWSTVAPWPTGEADNGAACELGGKLYVSGGALAGGVFFTPASQRLDVFDPGTGLWTALAPMPSPGQYGHGLASAAITIPDPLLALVNVASVRPAVRVSPAIPTRAIGGGP